MLFLCLGSSVLIVAYPLKFGLLGVVGAETRSFIIARY